MSHPHRRTCISKYNNTQILTLKPIQDHQNRKLASAMCHRARRNHPQETYSREGLLCDAETYQKDVAAGNSKFVQAAPFREAEGFI